MTIAYGRAVAATRLSRRRPRPARGIPRFSMLGRQSTTGVTPSDVFTARATSYPPVLDHERPAVWHHVEQNATNRELSASDQTESSAGEKPNAL